MSGLYNCKNFCGNSAVLICPKYLWKEISNQRLLEELISRNLVVFQKDGESGYFIIKRDIEDPCIE
jgi:hypothetical protein